MDQQQRAEHASRARDALSELTRRGVQNVAMTWIDTSGITRATAVPLSRLEHAAAWGVGVSQAFDTFLVDDSAAQGGSAAGQAGEVRLHPDLKLLTPLAAQPGWAWAPADRYTLDGLASPLDSRSTAHDAVLRLAEAGLRLGATFDTEWCVSIGPGDEFTPAGAGPAYGMTRLVEHTDYLRDIGEALARMHVEVTRIRPAFAAGQFELSVTADGPLAAADRVVLIRETIRAVGLRSGLRTSFAPKVLVAGADNAAHLHFSLWRAERNLMTGGSGPAGLTPECAAFVAGSLRRLPGLLAIAAPSVASYLRLIPGRRASAYSCWGVENTEAALSVKPGVVGERGEAASVELRCVDAAANPYLLLAAVIGAGLDGIDEKATLPAPVDVDPASLSDAERANSAIRRFPTTLTEATAAFVADPLFTTILGEPMVDTIATVRRGEIGLFEGARAEEVCARTRWRW